MNLTNALKTYELLKDHIPDQYEDHIDFVRKIVTHMIDSGRGTDYAAAIELIVGTDLSIEELKSFSTQDFLQTFTLGLIDLDIFSLLVFCKTLGI